MLTLRLYRALWCIAPPLIRHYLRRRARKNPAYLEHWDERFCRRIPADSGRLKAVCPAGAVWIHAVSVGETHAAVPLIRELRRHFPDRPLLITQMTPTGRDTAQKLFPDAVCRYLPYDRPDYVENFFQTCRPAFGVLMETEIWPNLMLAAREAGVPLFLANARLSEKSQRGYRKIRRLAAVALGSLSGCFAQTAEDAARLADIGAVAPVVAGNTKYDIVPPDAGAVADGFRRRIGRRPVVVCGSTRFYHGQDEARLLLESWRQYRGDALLVIVPRHPERFDDAFKTAEALGFRVQRRSDGLDVDAGVQVWIGDSMGEMAAYYQTADVVFVGGSLVDSGCQNIIEPMAAGRPVLFGPSVYNFAQAAAGAEAAGAAVRITDAAGWLKETQRLLDDAAARQDLAQRGLAFVRQHQGAGRRIAQEIARTVGQNRPS